MSAMGNEMAIVIVTGVIKAVKGCNTRYIIECRGVMGATGATFARVCVEGTLYMLGVGWVGGNEVEGKGPLDCCRDR